MFVRSLAIRGRQRLSTYRTHGNPFETFETLIDGQAQLRETLRVCYESKRQEPTKHSTCTGAHFNPRHTVLYWTYNTVAVLDAMLLPEAQNPKRLNTRFQPDTPHIRTRGYSHCLTTRFSIHGFASSSEVIREPEEPFRRATYRISECGVHFPLR